MRGTIVSYGPKDAPTFAQRDERPDGTWQLRGERGLTYSERLPDGNSLVAGGWWPADYTGEPLVSVDAELAETAGLKLGDYLTVSVLGAIPNEHISAAPLVTWIATTGF